MLSVAQLRRIEPNLKNLSDEEVLKIRDSYYETARIAFDDWFDNLQGFQKSQKGMDN